MPGVQSRRPSRFHIRLRWLSPSIAAPTAPSRSPLNTAKVVHEDASDGQDQNAAARAASGEISSPIDADSRMSRNMLVEIDRPLADGRYVGGGVIVLPERWSLGNLGNLRDDMATAAHGHRVSAGFFLVSERRFRATGIRRGVRQLEDLDLAHSD